MSTFIRPSSSRSLGEPLCPKLLRITAMARCFLVTYSLLSLLKDQQTRKRLSAMFVWRSWGRDSQGWGWGFGSSKAGTTILSYLSEHRTLGGRGVTIRIRAALATFLRT